MKTFGYTDIRTITLLKKTYGCEVLRNYLPISVEKGRKKMGLGLVLKIPLRQNGLTSSGQPNECNSNVTKLVVVYGGKRVVGYKIIKVIKGSVYGFCSHSVWKTPEGKLVDVTMSDSPLSVDKTGKFRMFIPMIEIENGYTENFPDFRTVGNPVKKGVSYLLEDGSFLDGELPTEFFMYKDGESVKRHLQQGGFLSPSIRSGKYRNPILKVS
jgi:hypothetical protein